MPNNLRIKCKDVQGIFADGRALAPTEEKTRIKSKEVRKCYEKTECGHRPAYPPEITFGKFIK